jgi:hypothetical protein
MAEASDQPLHRLQEADAETKSPKKKKKVGERCETVLGSDRYRVLLEPEYYKSNLQLIENEEEPLVKAIVTLAHCASS